MDKCPFSHNQITGSGNHSQAIASIFRQLKNGVDIIIDTPEKEQALFAYRIYQFANDFNNFQAQMNIVLDLIRDDPLPYKDIAKEIGEYLRKYGTNYFSNIESSLYIKSKLVAGLDTFHAFIKRSVLFAEFDEHTGKRVFPYIQAQQLASTALERGNMMIDNPDYDGWGGLFFDPNFDVSQLFLGIPISRPVYKCPVLYTGKFREITDIYFGLLCYAHEISIDKPKTVNWSDHSSLY